jgi:hypothetical protein
MKTGASCKPQASSKYGESQAWSLRQIWKEQSAIEPRDNTQLDNFFSRPPLDLPPAGGEEKYNFAI